MRPKKTPAARKAVTQKVAPNPNLTWTTFENLSRMAAAWEHKSDLTNGSAVSDREILSAILGALTRIVKAVEALAEKPPVRL